MGSKLSKNSVMPQKVISQVSTTTEINEQAKLNSLVPEPFTTQDAQLKHTLSDRIISVDENAIRFVQAVKRGNLNELGAIYKSVDLKDKVNLLNYRGMWGCTPLLSACLFGQTDVAIWLLDHDVDKDLCNERGVTPLLLASLEGLTPVVRKIIDKGDKPRALGMDNSIGIVYNASADRNMRLNPLLAASVNGHADIVELLLSNGAESNQNVDSVEVGGKAHQQRALLLSVKYRHTAVTRTLLRYAGDITLCDEDGNDALLLACESMNENCALVLIEEAKQQNCVQLVLLKCNIQGYTALHYASLHGLVNVCHGIIKNLDQVKLSLLLSIKTLTFEETALHLTSHMQNAGIVTALIEAGANGELKDSRGRTATQLMREWKN
uniref:Uncharacterized protein AlNc14C419G11505 n=1 Tax=Albugo laibachii Nc14 TaxID=890382 RepID=F0WZ98_9STRA|nr:hypothetical protein PITG_01794 [Albugo laibachii Nc14]|eukprot:CCA26816.1 hypothetical protein PITG_01794 [Albugo laibachii Nc14]